MSFSAGEIMFGWSVGGATEPLAHVSCNFGLSADASDELKYTILSATGLTLYNIKEIDDWELAIACWAISVIFHDIQPVVDIWMSEILPMSVPIPRPPFSFQFPVPL